MFCFGSKNSKEGEREMEQKIGEERLALEKRASSLVVGISEMDQQIKNIQAERAKLSKELRAVTQKLVTIELREKAKV